MKPNPVNPKKALNKAFLKVKPNRTDIDNFKSNLIKLIDTINESESEEFHKNLVSEFLKDTYYKENHFINTKGRTDLVIHNGKDAKSTVGVIIEAKKPTNKAEMLKKDNINTKAFQELVLYYLRERISLKNLEIKYLIATNIFEWFIFDVNIFEKEFAQNKVLVKQFTDFEQGRLAGKTTDFFYKEIAQPAFENIKNDIDYTYFGIREYEKPLRNNDKKDDNKLIALYKLLSPEHLLKLPFANDSNSLDKSFYAELLHIIGLSETKQGGKKLIGRKPENEKNPGSLIENAITILQYEDCISWIKASDYGSNRDEQLYSVALALVITWINRILFLKLLEGQLIKYHKGNSSYKFLTIEQISDYDALNKLFFQVLAIKESERSELVKKKFGKIPYLNSSLFEPNDLEHKTIRLSNLEDEYNIPILNSTVLKDKTGKRLKGEMNALEYLFRFLDAYDFAGEGAEDIQEDNKTLINASVLGLIFEKINGYKDGSFFTPGFITMYMARETIRRAVIQKFNDTKNWGCKNFNELYDKINDKKEANQIINSLKICDPAVGSGHFLVSALNEIIAIKSELKILLDRQGKTLRDYHVEVVNDELIVTDEDGNFFEYNPNNHESQRVQEVLFYEKKTIIENCLFGVDINPNSVKICRLRLWIELLKNAYYRQGTKELETLPNIDINIKCGNSLISRYALDADIKKALKKSKWDIDSYRLSVSTYRNAKSKEEKKAMTVLIDKIKNDFESEIAANDKRIIRLNKLRGELFAITTQTTMFEKTKKEKTEWNKNINKFTCDIQKLETELEELKNNKIYENAFEWRFEFPEVLNDDGDFIGFDVVIGNPPYIKEYEGKEIFNGLRELPCYQGKMDIWYLFGCLGTQIIKFNGRLGFIATNNWVTNSGASKFRNKIIKETVIETLIDFGNYMIFDSASIQTMILIYKNNKNIDNYKFDYRKIIDKEPLQENVLKILTKEEIAGTEIIQPKIIKKLFVNNLLTFFGQKKADIFEKMISKQNFYLHEKTNKKKGIKTEVGQGIVSPQDFVNKDNAQKIKLSKVGDGIFVLSQVEYEKFQMSKAEKKIFKPFYTSYELQRYYGNINNKYWIIYTDSTFNDKKRVIGYPNIKKHLDKYKSINTSDNYPYGLHRAREQYLFEGQKIISLRKCSNRPIFTYTDFSCYVSQTYYIIKTSRINLKYLTGLLNSKLIEFWLKYKGKMQGNNYQIDKEPLLSIPIYKPTDEYQENISKKVSQIITAKKQNPNADTDAIEKEIDQLVYKLYGLTEEEIKIVENN